MSNTQKKGLVCLPFIVLSPQSQTPPLIFSPSSCYLIMCVLLGSFACVIHPPAPPPPFLKCYRIFLEIGLLKNRNETPSLRPSPSLTGQVWAARVQAYWTNWRDFVLLPMLNLTLAWAGRRQLHFLLPSISHEHCLARHPGYLVCIHEQKEHPYSFVLQTLTDHCDSINLMKDHSWH